MTLTSPPRSTLPMVKDTFFNRRLTGLNIKARDLVLKSVERGVDVKITIVYAHGNEVTVFSTHPHLPKWPPPIEQLRQNAVTNADMTTYSMTSVQLQQMAHWRQAAGLESLNQPNENVPSNRNMSLSNGSIAGGANSAKDNGLNGGRQPTYFTDPTFGPSMSAGSASAPVISDAVTTREDLDLYLPQDNYGFAPDLFENGPTASHPSPAPTKIKTGYRSEEEYNEEEDDEEEDEFDNVYEDDDEDVGQFEEINHQAIVPYAGPSTPQSYCADNRQISPKRRRTENIGYLPMANAGGPQYMLANNQAPQMNNFNAVNGRKKLMKRPASLRQVQSASNLAQRSQVPQARMMHNATMRPNSFQGQVQMPARKSINRR